jgi:peptidoglycan hydrolase-like protein with peptidoglycan-binding domain
MPGDEVERPRRMIRVRRLTALAALFALAPSSAAVASSGGASLVPPPQNPRGFDSNAVVYNTFTRTLRYGEKGQDIKTLQTWLTELGYPVSQTGYFGSATKSAVTSYQIAHHLRPASGAVGVRTASSLAAAVRKVPKNAGVIKQTGAGGAWVFPLKPIRHLLGAAHRDRDQRSRWPDLLPRWRDRA